MTNEHPAWDSMLRGMADGEDLAYVEFWDLYGQRLNQIARRKLPESLQRRVEPEDLVQSVCRTFFRRVQEGQLELIDRDRLWRLLCAITLNKVRMQIRYHYRQRRQLSREAAATNTEPGDANWLDQLSGSEAGPDETAMFSEQLEGVLRAMDEEERRIIQLRMEGYEYEEIAARLNCSSRTIRRLTKQMRQRLRNFLLEALDFDAVPPDE